MFGFMHICRLNRVNFIWQSDFQFWYGRYIFNATFVLVFIAYWQIAGLVLAIPLTIILFFVLFAAVILLALYLNSFVGKIILRSQHRKSSRLFSCLFQRLEQLVPFFT